MRYKGDTICYILKPNGYIARGATIQTIKRILQEKFNPEDPANSLLNIDHFIDPTKPGAPIYEHIKLVPISLIPLRPILNKKRPIVEDQCIKPPTKSQVPFISLVPRSVSRQASLPLVPSMPLLPPLPLLPPALPPPLPLVLTI